MAHPNRPSLMSRLFPRDDRPAGRLSSTEDPSSSTLFSAEKAPFGSSSSASFQDESIRRNNLYQACFASFSSTTAQDRLQQDRAVEGDSLVPLKSTSAIKLQQSRIALSPSATNAFLFAEAFAEEAVELHTSTRNKLLEAQQDINSKISDFETLTSSIISVVDDIYANLSYPPSATLCSSDDFPSATIATHLASAKVQLEEAKKQLHSLQDEWEDNVRLEEDLRKELASVGKVSGQSDADHSRLVSFKEQVEQLVSDSTQALDEIEDTYKEEIQAERMKIMQAMLD
ncbi:hypothetical protein TGAM01_v206914 [Trichoderma gamsii]|uniref:Uncharacterized protein n=1 Tax=Trichoderma gamsii TaxID=398673 RepID=A0A2P4ZIV3_9HYPO|nr:hypothetical protein TGAM01_v206914 [Trichoderma gamsii]PON24226.1 hypothetical protein TGAM01_v206914 [Trichoderma gamsii]